MGPRQLPYYVMRNLLSTDQKASKPPSHQLPHNLVLQQRYHLEKSPTLVLKCLSSFSTLCYNSHALLPPENGHRKTQKSQSKSHQLASAPDTSVIAQ